MTERFYIKLYTKLQHIKYKSISKIDLRLNKSTI